MSDASWPENFEPVGLHGHHPVFDAFPAYEAPCNVPGVMGWDGSVFVAEIFSGIRPPDALRFRLEQVQLDHILDACVFEWIDLLESVMESSDTFRFAELGAGYGRWAIRAFRAASVAGIHPSRIHVLTVEADAQHSDWLLRNVTANGIPSSSHSHFDGAVSDRQGIGDFFVLQPGASDSRLQAQTWYGQSLVRDDNRWEGAKTKEVPVTTLSDLLQSSFDNETVDLIDMDLQGEELAVVREALPALRNVRKLHIATHSLLIEEHLHSLLLSDNWRLVRRYAPNSRVHTHYGEIEFTDGIMTWRNPRFDN